MENLSREIMTKWIVEEQYNNQELGSKLRGFYWQTVNKKENNEENLKPVG